MSEKGGAPPHYDDAVLVSFYEKGGVRTHYNDASYEMHMWQSRVEIEGYSVI